MRKKWRPQVKQRVVLRGINTQTFFLKSTDIDSPFTCVKKEMNFSVGRHLYTAKGALK